MRRALASKKDDRIGNLGIGGHALAQGYVFFDRPQGCFGVIERVEPAPIHGLHDFGRYDRVYPDSPVRKIEGPFPGQRIHGSFGRGVSRGAPLSGNRNLRTYVNYVSFGLHEFIQGKVGEGENVEYVFAQTLEKVGG